MKRKVLVIIVLLTTLIPVVLVSAMVFRIDNDVEPQVVLEVPYSWGEPVSIARRAASVTILFSEGHIVIVRIGILHKQTYAIKITRIEG